MKHLPKTALLLSLVLLIGACSSQQEGVPPEGNRPRLSLTVTPAYLSDGELDTPYTFTLQAKGVLADVQYVTFTWNFAGGSTGSTDVLVENGTASLAVTQAYSEAGVYGLVAAVEGGGRTATTSAIISVGGATAERPAVLGACGEWVTMTQGAYGVTIDRWDISALPKGAILDLKFDTVGIPDRIIVEYPDGTVAHDTGWRGDAKHNGDPLYPGGVTGPKTGEVSSVFTKANQNLFEVTVIGPDPRTLWNYKVRCRTN